MNMGQRRNEAYYKAVASMVRGEKPRRYVNKLRNDLRKLWNEERQRLIELGLDPFDYAFNYTDGGISSSEMGIMNRKSSIGKSMFTEELKLGG